jgi:hypothetical protein
MTDSTVDSLNAIAGATPAGLQAADLFYVVRPGAPDADFKASAGDLSTFIAGLGYVPATRTVNGHALSGNVTVSKSDLGLGSVENTALSTWAGGANLTTLGTITTGTWNGTTLAVAHGGTGLTGGTSGGIPYFSGAATLSSSAALTANAIVKGGGAGAAPVASGVLIDGSNNITGAASVTVNAGGGSGTFKSMGCLSSNVTAVANSGTGETDLMTYALPAGSLAAGKIVRIFAWGTTANNANTKTIRSYIGATLMSSFNPSTSVAHKWWIDIIIVCTGTNAETYMVNNFVDTATSTIATAGAQSTAAEATGSAITLKITGQSSAAGSDVTQNGMIIEFMN